MNFEILWDFTVIYLFNFFLIQDSNHLEACCAEFFIDGTQIGFLGKSFFNSYKR